jgi:hypothetical protein
MLWNLILANIKGGKRKEKKCDFGWKMYTSLFIFSKIEPWFIIYKTNLKFSGWTYTPYIIESL